MAAPAERRNAAESQNGIGDVLASIRRMITEDDQPAERALPPGPAAAATPAPDRPGVLRLDAPLPAAPPSVAPSSVAPAPVAPPPLILADPVAAGTRIPVGTPDPALSRLTRHDSPEAARLRASALRDAIRARLPGETSLGPQEGGRAGDAMPEDMVASMSESAQETAQDAVVEAGGTEAFDPPGAAAGAAPAAIPPAGQMPVSASSPLVADAPVAAAPADAAPVAPAPSLPMTAPVCSETSMPAWGSFGPAAPTGTAMATGQPAASADRSGGAFWPTPSPTPTPAQQPVSGAMPGPVPLPESASPPAMPEPAPAESFFAEVIREVVRQELRGEDSSRASQALRTMVLREVARAITGGPL